MTTTVAWVRKHFAGEPPAVLYEALDAINSIDPVDDAQAQRIFELRLELESCYNPQGRLL